jgi:hypothetical protein
MKNRCPEDSVLIRLFMGDAPSREAARLSAHMGDCARCALRFDILKQLNRELKPQVEAFAGEISPVEAAPLLARAAADKMHALIPDLPADRPTLLTRPSGIPLFVRFTAGFLAILAVIVVGAYLGLARGDKLSNLRSPSFKLALLEPSGRISSCPTVFRWTPVLQAENYVFELIDDSLHVVHNASTYLIHEYILPADVRSGLVKGRTYVWSISAYDSDSNLLTSGSGAFVLD